MRGQGTGGTMFTELKGQRILTRVAMGVVREPAPGATLSKESVDERPQGGPVSGVI